MAPKIKVPKFLIALSFAFSATQVFSQNQKEPIELTAGIEIRGLVPISFFTMDSVVLNEENNNFNAVYSYKGGLGFGGVIRVKFTDFWNLETGIYFTRRNYDYQVRDASVDFIESTTMTTVGYEIPVKGLVYIQMADNIFMNVALGVSADFFASDTEIQKRNYNVVAFKHDWVKLGVLGSVGAEYRTEDNGYFYLGGSFHQTFGNIYSTQVNYSRGGSPPTYFRNGEIDGSYFSVDFKYFFPPKKKEKSKIKFTKPDWKNM